MNEPARFPADINIPVPVDLESVHNFQNLIQASEPIRNIIDILRTSATKTLCQRKLVRSDSGL